MHVETSLIFLKQSKIHTESYHLVGLSNTESKFWFTS